MPASETLKHKEQNRHRFLTFSERLAQVSVDAVHRIVRTTEEEGENVSKFQECLHKWHDEDRSLPFRAFYSEIASKCDNFVMVVHYKEDIVGALKKHLAVPDSLALAALCELLVALCMDLRSDMYPHFAELFQILTRLLVTKDLTRMESIFSAISLLFKYLWRCMVADMDSIFSLYSPLICGEHPAHIAGFAGESFSFLLRKASSQDNICKPLFGLLDTNERAVDGVSKALFYVLKGTKGTLHSCTERILPKVLDVLDGEGDVASSKAFECVNATVTLLAGHVESNSAHAFWEIIIKTMQKSKGSHLGFLFRLCNTWCGFRSGKLIVNSNSLVKTLCNYLETHVSSECSEAYLELCSTVLLAETPNVPWSHKQILLKDVAESSRLNLHEISPFWARIFDQVKSSSFGLQILLKFCLRKSQDRENRNGIILLLASYILDQCPQPADAGDVETFSPVPLDFGPISREKGMKKIQQFLVDILQEAEMTDDKSFLWCKAIVVQHLRPTGEGTVKHLCKLFRQSMKNLASQIEDATESLALARILLQVIYVVGHGHHSSLKVAYPKFMKLLVRKYATDPNSLFMVDLMLDKKNNSSSLEPGDLGLLYENLSSHDPAIRKFSLQILGKIHIGTDIFKTCVLVEETPATVQDYRTKVLHLNKLAQAKDQQSEVACAVFRFVVSNFYLNFSPFWSHVKETIVSLLPGDRTDPLWQLLLDLLQKASSNCQDSNSLPMRGSEIGSSDQQMDRLFYDRGVKIMCGSQTNARVDHFNHRLLLWETLATVAHSEVVESYSRHLVGYFLEYLDKEHHSVDRLHAPNQNIASNGTVRTRYNGINKKVAVKTLTAFLSLFSNFKNPRSVKGAERLRAAYNELLMHEDTQIQIGALNCIFTYRDKHVLAHKVQLLALLDNDKIKDAMVHFHVGEIEEDERSSLVPVLFRIMYGRMTAKTGLGSHGRSQVHDRRAIVLRFLSGLNREEMQQFLLLAIEPVSHYVTDMDVPVGSGSLTGFDLSRMVPLSRQRGILSTLQEVLRKHTNLITKYMFDYMLNLLLTQHLMCSAMLGIYKVEDMEDRFEVDKSFGQLTRAVSKQVHGVICDLVGVWPDVAFSSNQIQSIFAVLVDPHIHRMKNECISDPNPLLHFFDKLASRREFVFLLAHRTEAGRPYPIESLIEVLLSEKTSPSICKLIVSMILRIMENEDGSSDSKNDLVLHTLRNINTNLCDIQETDISKIGLKIVSNYLQEIMTYFVVRLKDRKKSVMVIKSQLKILSLFGDQIAGSELSSQMAELLLEHVSKVAKFGNMDKNNNSSREEHILPALTTLSVVATDTSLIPSIAKLFSVIQNRLCRLTLVEILEKLVSTVTDENSVPLRKCASVVKRMNAWDARFVEEVDYDLRLGAIQEFVDWMEGDEASTLLQNKCVALLPLVHSSLFTLFHYCDDLSMRESSSRAICLVVKVVMESTSQTQPSPRQVVIDGLILPAIQLGLRSTDENLRHECVRLLVEIAKLSPKSSSLSDILVLCNDTDPDSDFFQNMQHIQPHRRSRAFKKLAKIIVTRKEASSTVVDGTEGDATQDTLISYKMVLNYLLPLSVQTLLTQDLSKHLHLRDACLEVVSSVASVMPWPAYLQLLKQNMASIRKHAVSVRIVCSILYAFHFDVPDNSVEKVDEEWSGESKEAASIYQTVVFSVLPQLNDLLAGKSKSKVDAKQEYSTQADDEDPAARAPLAIAIVSVLGKMPASVLDTQLSTVLLKIIMLLRHRYPEVRAAASKTVVGMADSLGPRHLHIILKDLQSGLVKGYQKHVLIQTVGAVLHNLQEKLTMGDLDNCVGVLVSIAVSDLFGENEVERNVEKIRSKTPEARGKSRSYNIYRVLSQFVKKEALLSIIAPLKKVLDTKREHSVQRIVENVLREITQGLQENSGMTPEDILVFLHGVLTETLPVGSPSDTSGAAKAAAKKKKGFRPDSCFLLSTEPERYGVKEVKKARKTNMHLIIEFALQFLNSSLKKQVLSKSNEKHLEMLDPFVDILKCCLTSAHTKTVSFSTQSLTKLLRFSLPSLDSNASEIIKTLMTTLRENSRGSTSAEIAAATFKALSVLGQSRLGEHLSETQLEVLLGYAEEVLYEKERQSHAFNLIQSILNQGAQFAELIDVMNKTRDICIQSHDTAAMGHARQLYVYYLTRYPMTPKKLMAQMEFILAQLSYEFESGRLSALELVASLITSFPENMLTRNAGTMFVSVSAMLVNDESVQCRKLAAHVIRMLIKKLPVEERDNMFSLVLHWYGQDESQPHQQLASIVVTCFAEAEQMEFHRHLPKLLPLLADTLANAVDNHAVDTDEVASTDHFLFHLLSAVHSLLQNCKLSRDSTFEAEISKLLSSNEKLLLHPHTWVRIISAQIFGTVFGSWEPDELGRSASLRDKTRDCSYLVSDLEQVTKRLAIAFCQQIRSPILDPKLSDQCIKNLVFIIKVLNSMEQHRGGDASEKAAPGTDSLEKPRAGIKHILAGLVKAAKNEAAYSIKQTQKRTMVLKFCAAVCVSLPDVSPYLGLILDPVYRETERKIGEYNTAAKELKKLSAEVSDIVKSKVTASTFTSAYSSVAKRVMGSRRERKRLNDLKLVSDPAAAAASKIRKQAKKKVQRKRKLASARPEYQQKLKKKRRKLVDEPF